jgi:hypothetical protein
MARPKRAPLYEVLAKSKNPPGWIRQRHRSEDEAGAESEPPNDVADAPAPEATEPVPQAATPPAGAVDKGASDERIIVIDGRVVRLALTSTTAAIVIFVLVAAVVAAFWTGRSAGLSTGREQGYEKAQQDLEAEGIDAIELARRGPPETGLFEGIGESPIGTGAAAEDPDPVEDEEARRPESPAPRAPATTEWVKGLTYVVVQEFHRTAGDDARRAQAYLAKNNIDTALIELSTEWGYRLITRKGFDWDSQSGRRECDQFLKRLRQIGKAYWNSGGGYKLEGYPKKLTNDHW